MIFYISFFLDDINEYCLINRSWQDFWWPELFLNTQKPALNRQLIFLMALEANQQMQVLKYSVQGKNMCPHDVESHVHT